MSSSVTSIVVLQKRVEEMLPNLSKAEAQVLGLLTYGILMLNKCGITALSHGLAKIVQEPTQRLRQRLREFYYEAEAKRGKKRRAVDVQRCFPELLRQSAAGLGGEKGTGLVDRCHDGRKKITVLNISVVYRGCGITVAWKIIEAGEKGSWRPHWEGLLASLEGVVPKDMKVIVMADQGTVRGLALSSDPKAGMASDAAGERGSEF